MSREYPLENLKSSWKEKTGLINAEGERLSVEEWMLEQRGLARNSFEKTRQIAQETLSKGKKVLVVDLTGNRGIRFNEKLKSLDPEQVKLFDEIETGSSDTEPGDFTSAGIARFLGLVKGEYDVLKIYEDQVTEFPNKETLKAKYDLVVFSGSAMNMLEETNPEHLYITQRITNLHRVVNELAIPELGICFGAQFLNSMFGEGIEGGIDWVTPEDHSVPEEGVVRLKLTDAGRSSNMFLNQDLAILETHFQHINPDKQPSELVVLASSEKSQVQIALSGDNLLLMIQGHPEKTMVVGCISAQIEGRTLEELNDFSPSAVFNTREAISAHTWQLVKAKPKEGARAQSG